VARYFVMGDPVYQLIRAGRVEHIARGPDGGNECKRAAMAAKGRK
jgi:hypothetical protein